MIRLAGRWRIFFSNFPKKNGCKIFFFSLLLIACDQVLAEDNLRTDILVIGGGAGLVVDHYNSLVYPFWH